MTRPLLIVLVVFFGFSSFVQVDEEPMFKVIKSKPDRSLKQDETSLNLHFSDGKGKAIKSSIQISYNGTKRSVSPDSKGKASYKLKPGKYYLTFFYKDDHYTIRTDSIQLEAGHSTSIDLKFKSSILLSW